MKINSRLKSKIVDDITKGLPLKEISRKHGVYIHDIEFIKDNNPRARHSIINGVEYVVCKHCKNNKEYNETNFSRRSDNGRLMKICKQCKATLAKVKRINNPDIRKRNTEYKRIQREKNRDKYNEYMKQYRERNKEKIREYEKKKQREYRMKKILNSIKEKRLCEL